VIAFGASVVRFTMSDLHPSDHQPHSLHGSTVARPLRRDHGDLAVDRLAHADGAGAKDVA
jgi:hypothetical protein